MIDRLLCTLGIHGPHWYGDEGDHRRALRTQGFVRECRFCGATWHGSQVYYRTHRGLGNWRRVS
jgi:hypothetical protein